jgi:hypothetical protein
MMRVMGAVLVALVLAACAGNRAGMGGNTLTVMVQNDGAIPSQVRVFLVQSAGPEINLGTLPTLGTGTLTTTVEFTSGQYRLRAQGGTDAVQFSPPFAAAPGDVIQWDMRRNVIQRP